MTRILAWACLCLLAASTSPGAAQAEIKIGALLSLTGPAAGLGIPARNTIELLPKTIGDETVRWIVLDDTSDTTAAVQAARKMIDEEHVDVILGPSNTPNSLAVLDVANTSGTPFLSLSGSNVLIDPQEGPKRWAFKMFPSEKLSIAQMLEHMKAKGITTLAMIGFSNALGDSFMGTMRNLAASYGVTIPVETRYNPPDTSVAAQVLRMISTKPGAVFVVGSSVPATTPIIELRNRGYSGDIYTIMGIAGPDAIRVGGKSLDGVLLSGVAVLAAEQLADTNPIKPAALRFISAYEAKYGAGSRNLFGATMWDAFFLVDAAAKPALATGKPGTSAFRTALRDGMEQVKGMAGAQGLFSLSPTDHSGAEPASQVMIEIRNGGYHLVK